MIFHMPSKHTKQHSNVKHGISYSLQEMQFMWMNTNYVNKVEFSRKLKIDICIPEFLYPEDAKQTWATVIVSENHRRKREIYKTLQSRLARISVILVRKKYPLKNKTTLISINSLFSVFY